MTKLDILKDMIDKGLPQRLASGRTGNKAGGLNACQATLMPTSERLQQLKPSYYYYSLRLLLATVRFSC